MTATLRLDRRLSRAARASAYLAVNVPIAVLAVLALIGLALGAALNVVGVRSALGLATTACRGVARLDRRAANRFLDLHIGPVPDALDERMVALLVIKPFVIGGLLAVVLVPVVLFVAIVVLAVQGIAGLEGVDYVGPWPLGLGTGLVLCALIPAAAVLVIAAFEALYAVLRAIGRARLTPRGADEGPVRELLAESLGDSTVSIAYWLPDRGVFVDEAGAPVTPPEPGSGRAWTAVERDGRRVAAIVHDAALDTSMELVQAAATASSLAIDNERLKADLRARVAELRVSRQRIVQAADDARRRIERDLHDGAQQQLLALALELRVLRSRINGHEAAPLVDGLAERLEVALGELRELARGIHPALLTQSGLGPAVGALAERTPVPVDTEVTVEGRLPPAVESAAYFVVAEALTNVARYAHASRASVEIVRDGGHVVVVVSDDGIGGVDVTAGSGLRGLQDRVAAVDGTLRIESPDGAGTTLRARIPIPGGAKT